MKKRTTLIAVIMVVTMIALMFVGIKSACAWGNQAWFDTTYTFDRAVINLFDGTVVEGDVQSWQDYEDSDVVQVKIDGKVYLTHYTNVVLIAE